MALAETLTTIERILAIGGPLITALVGDDNTEAAKGVIDATTAALEYARLGLDGIDNYAEDLQEIVDDLEALEAAGGPGETEFDAVSDRIKGKTARLVEIAAARRAAD